MNKFITSIVLGAVLVLGGVSSVVASAPTRLVSQEQVSSSGPMSFQMFCAVNPGECVGGGSSKIKLDDSVVKILQQVNAKVNRSIRPRLDNAAFQIWQVNPRAGDCKSYTISKRHELIKAGLPASALRIAFVKTGAGEGHAVLVVKTDKGDLALDNLSRDINLMRNTGYRLVAISQADPKRWS